MLHWVSHFVIHIKLWSCKPRREVGVNNPYAVSCLDQVGHPSAIELLSNAFPLFKFFPYYPFQVIRCMTKVVLRLSIMGKVLFLICSMPDFQISLPKSSTSSFRLLSLCWTRTSLLTRTGMKFLFSSRDSFFIPFGSDCRLPRVLAYS